MNLNEFVDKVFVVSLPEREDRFQSAKFQLELNGIEFEKWVADKMDDGKEGLKVTMSKLFRHCIDHGYKKVCVFEDDIKVLFPIKHISEKCYEQLPKDFDLFYFGGNVWRQPTKYSENLLQTPCIYSTHAIVYSKQAIEYIFPLLSQPKAYDVILVDTIQKKERCYCSNPLMISQTDGYSDILKRKVKYDNFIEKRFKEKVHGI